MKQLTILSCLIILQLFNVTNVIAQNQKSTGTNSPNVANVQGDVNIPAKDKQVEPAVKYSEIAVQRKLNLRDIQVEYFGKEQQIKNLNAQIEGLKAQIAQVQQEEIQQINPKWQAEVDATVKDAGYDPAKVTIDLGTTSSAKDIKFAAKEKK